MKLQVVGCSHHKANVQVREQLAFSESQVPSFLSSFYETYPDAEAVCCQHAIEPSFTRSRASKMRCRPKTRCPNCWHPTPVGKI